jgi:Phospholipase B
MLYVYTVEYCIHMLLATEVRSTFVQVEGLSYQLAPRAAVFRRDEGDATDIATLQRLMRSNNWAADSVRMLHLIDFEPVNRYCHNHGNLHVLQEQLLVGSGNIRAHCGDV